MFETYPGFEELTLRVEVQWRQQARTALTRVERWPKSGEAAIVCEFEGEENDDKWLINGYHPNPKKLLWNNVTFDTRTRKTIANWQWKTRRESQLRALVQRAFEGCNFYALRLVYLPELPAEPRVAIPQLGYGPYRIMRWIKEGRLYDHQDTAFKISSEYWSLKPRKEVTKEQLLAEWNDPHSHARFAWQLSSVSRPERQQSLLGYNGDLGELEQVMQWILLSSTKFWQQASSWYWTFPFEPEENEINRLYGYGGLRIQGEEKAAIETYLSLLRAHFVPNSQGDSQRDKSFIPYEFRVLADVKITQAPTSHQQLEAELQLREWLRDKATPQQIKELLDT